MLSFIARDVLVKVWDLIESVSEGFFYLLISDAQISSKLHNGKNDLEGLENKIYTMMKGRETFNGDHIVPINNFSEV